MFCLFLEICGWECGLKSLKKQEISCGDKLIITREGQDYVKHKLSLILNPTKNILLSQARDSHSPMMLSCRWRSRSDVGPPRDSVGTLFSRFPSRRNSWKMNILNANAFKAYESKIYSWTCLQRAYIFIFNDIFEPFSSQ